MESQPSSSATVRIKSRKDDAPSIATDFSHPVYKRLSQINGAINKLNREELMRKLTDLHLSSRWVDIFTSSSGEH